ncbi:Cell division protein FtsX [Sphingobacterium daejeonense]|nr:Cell division protein FtsX [Sphingobacterium daejeonense]
MKISLNILGRNPLLPSIDIYMKEQYANSDSIQTFINKISKNSRIKEVVYQESLIDMVNKNIRVISIVILAFTVVLLIIAVALINNTIRLAIYSQRFLIKSMQLIGATKGFIRRALYLIWYCPWIDRCFDSHPFIDLNFTVCSETGT